MATNIVIAQSLNTLDIKDYYQRTLSDAVVMAYKGAASGDLLNGMMSVVQTRLEDLEPKSGLKKRVFSILVEMLQNIYHHFGDLDAEQVHEDDSIVFLLWKNESGYVIITGNYVFNSDMLVLKQRIDNTNALSPEELKAKYREVLDNQTFSDKGGAGLGIIDIARKSGGKLEYDFKYCNDKYSFFSLTVKISAIS